MYEWAKPGVKVVCVSYTEYEDWVPLTIGTVYTIREIFIGKKKSGEEVPAVHLVGIFNKYSTRGIERGYHLAGFKPLVEPKALPSVLTTLLIAPGKRIKNDQFDKKRYGMKSDGQENREAWSYLVKGR